MNKRKRRKRMRRRFEAEEEYSSPSTPMHSLFPVPTKNTLNYHLKEHAVIFVSERWSPQ